MPTPPKSYKLYNEDCFETFARIKSGSVDMVMVDPPYGTTACKWDSIIPLEPMWKELKRIVKPSGAMLFTASQPFTSVLICSDLKMFKYCWVWDKIRGTGFQISKIKPMCNHEDIVVFGRGRLLYNPQMRPREKPRLSKNKGTTRQMVVSRGCSYTASVPLAEKYPVTIITFGNNNQRDKVHPTQKPVALMEYLVKTFSNKDDTVLDFAIGSGTTGVACGNLGRRFIGCDNDVEHGYFETAKERIEKAYANSPQTA